MDHLNTYGRRCFTILDPYGIFLHFHNETKGLRPADWRRRGGGIEVISVAIKERIRIAIGILTSIFSSIPPNLPSIPFLKIFLYLYHLVPEPTPDTMYRYLLNNLDLIRPFLEPFDNLTPFHEYVLQIWYRYIGGIYNGDRLEIEIDNDNPFVELDSWLMNKGFRYIPRDSNNDNNNENKDKDNDKANKVTKSKLTIYGFNLPSDFFLNKYKEDISKLCEYADIIFANKAEATYFAKALKLKINKDEDIEDIALNLCKNIPKINVNKKRIVVVTCGQNPAACCEYDHKEKKVTFLGTFEVRDVPQENIIDTNGAGDSFAGGFLSQLVKGKKLDECMKAGHWAASIIIQKRGCNITMDIKFNNNSI